MTIRSYSLIAFAAALLAGCTSSSVLGPVQPANREAEAQAALDRGDYAEARSLYSSLVSGAVGDRQTAFRIALARAEVELGQPEAALASLDAIGATVTGSFDADIAAIRAAAWFALGRTVDAVELLIDREIWLETSGDILDNQSRIWDGLSLPLSATASRMRTGDDIVDGWLALTPLTRLDVNDEQFFGALTEWRTAFPNHPAAGGILADRVAATRTIGTRPARIALLLPLGSAEWSAAARAIQDGFFAGLFDSGNAGETTIRIYDTAQRGSVDSFLAAQLEGADFIVGPLLPDEVGLVQAQAGFVPTLALNIAPQDQMVASSFYQFALSSEDEIDAIAARAIRDGHRTAGVLYTSSARGRRQMMRFQNAFEARGGRVIGTAIYASNSSALAGPVEQLLNVSLSEARLTRLEANLGRTIEYEPRRRADIDMIFLQADPGVGPADARLILPLLRDNNARPEDLPIYATSDVHDPTRIAGEPDLDGLIFPDVPLLVPGSGTSATPARLLQQQTTTNIEQNKRLFAFGFDAYRLVEQLYSNSGSGWPVSGATGELYLGDAGRIRRTLPFASFSEGRPVPLEADIETFSAR